MNFDWFMKLIVHMFQLLKIIYTRGNFLYHNWGFTSIYRPLFYPFRSLIIPKLFLGRRIMNNDNTKVITELEEKNKALEERLKLLTAENAGSLARQAKLENRCL